VKDYLLAQFRNQRWFIEFWEGDPIRVDLAEPTKTWDMSYSTPPSPDTHLYYEHEDDIHLIFYTYLNRWDWTVVQTEVQRFKRPYVILFGHDGILWNNGRGFIGLADDSLPEVGKIENVNDAIGIGWTTWETDGQIYLFYVREGKYYSRLLKEGSIGDLQGFINADWALFVEEDGTVHVLRDFEEIHTLPSGMIRDVFLHPSLWAMTMVEGEPHSCSILTFLVMGRA